MDPSQNSYFADSAFGLQSQNQLLNTSTNNNHPTASQLSHLSRSPSISEIVHNLKNNSSSIKRPVYRRLTSLLGHDYEDNIQIKAIVEKYEEQIINMQEQIMNKDEQINHLQTRLKEKQDQIASMERKHLQVVKERMTSRILSVFPEDRRTLPRLTPGATPLDLSLNSDIDSIYETQRSIVDRPQQTFREQVKRFITEEQHSFDGEVILDEFIGPDKQILHLYQTVVSDDQSIGEFWEIPQIDKEARKNCLDQGIQTEEVQAPLKSTIDTQTDQRSIDETACQTITEAVLEGWSQTPAFMAMDCFESDSTFDKLRHQFKRNLNTDEFSEEYLESGTNNSKLSTQNLETQQTEHLHSTKPFYAKSKSIVLSPDLRLRLAASRTLDLKITPSGSWEQSLMRFKTLVKLSTETVNTIWKAVNQHSRRYKLESMNTDLQNLKGKLKGFVDFFNSGYLKIRDTGVKDDIFEQKAVSRLREVVQMARELLKDNSATDPVK